MPPLIETKLHPPRLPLGLIKRTQLLSRLDTDPAHKLTLLLAPAGSGKSTLVNHWRTEHRPASSVAWISLDSSDNDLIHFWHTILTASQTWYPTPDENIRSMLLSSTPPPFKPLSLEAILTAFLNQLARQNVTGWLILDNYHTITEARIHETLNFLIAHLPETVHIVLLTRTEPPLALARLRANGDLNEIHAQELRFSQAETTAFLEQAVAYPLTPDMLERIGTQLEGWAAGLRLLALSLQGKATQIEVERVLTTFRGKHRPIRDYFVTEVLRAQSEELQDFLLRTSLLPRINSALCIAVTERRDSAALLETIERSNLFLEVLDDTDEWYQYQVLFAEAMQHEALQRLGETTIRRLSHLASCWFEQQGLLSEAIEAALKIQAHERTANLIEQYIKTMHLQELDEYHIVHRWLIQLPDPIIRQHPQLCLSYATTLIFRREAQQTGQIEPALFEELLHIAEESWRADNNTSELGKVFALRAFFGASQGMREQALTWAKQALVWLPATETTWRGMSLSTLGMEAMQNGDLNQALRIFQEIKSLWQVGNNVLILDGITLLLGFICFEQGKLQQAFNYLHQLHQDANTHQNHVVSAIALMGIAQIFYEWNDLERSEQQIQELLQSRKQFPTVPQEIFQIPIELTLARIQYAQGEVEPAVQRIEALLINASVAPKIFLYFYQEILSWLVRHTLSVRDYNATQDWLDDLLTRQEPSIFPISEMRLLNASSASPEPEPSQPGTAVAIQTSDQMNPIMFQEQRTMIMARLSIARGETGAALNTLTQLLPAARSAGRGRTALQITLLIAQTYAARKQLPEARHMLLEGLKQAYIEGHQRTFLDEGDTLLQLLRDLLPHLRNQPLHSYAKKLLRAFAPAHTSQSTIVTPITDTLYEPLSPQEQRVLRLLAAGRSNAEIASELVVSINTIRTQVQSIYHKLQVNNRHAASNIARNLHLI